jgi:epsilon-lactone hydrolase
MSALRPQASFPKTASAMPLTPETTAWLEVLAGMMGGAKQLYKVNPDTVAVTRMMADGVIAGPIPMAADVDVSTEATEVKAATGVGGVWFSWPGLGDGSPVIVSFHGGAQIAGNARGDQLMLTHLSRIARARVLSVEYTLSPEAAIPDQIGEGVRVYEHLLRHAKMPASKIALAGGSGGGSYVLLCAQYIANKGLPAPAAVWCQSPWIDLGLTHPESLKAAREITDRDVFVGTGEVEYRKMADIQRHAGKPDELGLTDPRWNALHGTVEGLPPIWMTCSTDEWVIGQTRVFVDRARAAGASVKLSAQPGVPHCWPLWLGAMPEGREELAAVGYWLREKLHGAI